MNFIRRIQVELFPSSLLKRFRSDFSRRIFYLKQYEMTQKRVWGLELTVMGLKEAREILRREYDKLTEDLDANTKAIEAAKDEEVKKKLQERKEGKEKELTSWKEKIDLSDETIKDVEGQITGFLDNLPLIERMLRN